MKKLILLIIILTCLTSSYSFSKEKLSTKSKKAEKLYNEALTCLDTRNVACVHEKLNEALSIDSLFVEALLLMTDVCDMEGKVDDVFRYSNKAIGADLDQKFPIAYFYNSKTAIETGNYNAALKSGNIFLSLRQYTGNQLNLATRIVRNSAFALKQIEHPVPFTPLNLGKQVNSMYDEYWPSLSVDEKELVFTRLMPKDTSKPIGPGNRQEDFYQSSYSDTGWEPSKYVNGLNTLDNEGAQSLSSDGQIMFFTACERRDGMGKCDIYYSVKQGESWSPAINLGVPVNSNFSEKQPSISSDGRTLYFVSNRAEGKGKYDIWMSVLGDDNRWGKPVNLGDSINSPENEQSPYIHADNRTLYFASDGWTGMGGLDLFYSTLKDNGKWAQPVNLGYPINTYANEAGLAVNASGNHAYFSSNRESENGMDLYEFELYEQARPQLISYMKGRVFDAETSQPLSARFELIDIATSKLISQARSSKNTGEFLCALPTEKDYALNVSRKGYLFYSENFAMSSTNDKTKPYIKDIPLQPIKPGSKAVLKNIFFETNSYELKKASTAELGKLIQFMNDNPGVKIEISGHTDNTGSKELNYKLSENRAKTVADYLVGKGIPTDRLTYKGYGEKQPVADNKSEDGRAQNRRTEFKITSI